MVPPPRVEAQGESDLLIAGPGLIWERENGAATKSRTRDLLITSQLLYHG